MNNHKRKRNTEAGSTTLEFAAALPLFLLLVGGIGIFAWLYWAQAAAGIAAVRGLREGSISRGETVDPALGRSFFESSMGSLTGPRTAGTVGAAETWADDSRRSVAFGVGGAVHLKFGPLDSVYTFGGGGFGRQWRFWPGPPDGWE
jgi:Flp pilus assembly protein TadG